MPEASETTGGAARFLGLGVLLGDFHDLRQDFRDGKAGLPVLPLVKAEQAQRRNHERRTGRHADGADFYPALLFGLRPHAISSTCCCS